MSNASAIQIVRGEGPNLYAVEVQGRDRAVTMYARGRTGSVARRTLHERESISFSAILSTRKVDPNMEVIV